MPLPTGGSVDDEFTVKAEISPCTNAFVALSFANSLPEFPVAQKYATAPLHTPRLPTNGTAGRRYVAAPPTTVALPLPLGIGIPGSSL